MFGPLRFSVFHGTLRPWSRQKENDIKGEKLKTVHSVNTSEQNTEQEEIPAKRILSGQRFASEKSRSINH